jgi:hypothetical protein
MLACFHVIKESKFSLIVYKFVISRNENLVTLSTAHLSVNLINSCA